MKEEHSSENVRKKVVITLLAGIGVVAFGVMLLWTETEGIRRYAGTGSQAEAESQAKADSKAKEESQSKADNQAKADSNAQAGHHVDDAQQLSESEPAYAANAEDEWETQSCFQTTLSEYESPVEVQIVLGEGSSFPSIYIREGGDLVEALQIGDLEERQNSTFESMGQVFFRDYDMDQDTDILVFYTTDAGRRLQIFEGYDAAADLLRPGFENLGFGAKIAERIGERGMELNKRTFQEVVGCRYGEEYRFFSWQDAWRFVAGLDDIRYGEMACYDLIYVDEDDVPELLVWDQKNPVGNLYTYEDGKVYRVIEEWRYSGYGAGVEPMRDYFPRGNRLYYFQLYGGRMSYDETILSLDDTHHLKLEADTYTVFSDGEEPTEGAKQEHFCEDRQITEEENREYLRDYYENREQYRAMEGRYGYEEFQEVLAEHEETVEDEEVYEAFLRGEITGIGGTGVAYRWTYLAGWTWTDCAEKDKNREYFYFDLDEDGKNELIVRINDVGFSALKRVKNELLVMFVGGAYEHIAKVGDQTGILGWQHDDYGFNQYDTDGGLRRCTHYKWRDKNGDGEMDERDLYLKWDYIPPYEVGMGNREDLFRVVGF